MRVAVIDDDPGIGHLVAIVVEGRGHAVTRYTTGDAAWRGVQATPYELLIIDWMLPGLDGLELCRRVRGLPWGQDAVLVVMTARSSGTDISAALDAGADDFLAKPFDLALLETRLTIAERHSALVAAHAAAEEQREGAEERYRTLTEHLPSVTYMTSPGAEGTALYMSPQIEHLVGFTVAEWTATPDFWITRLHPDDRERRLEASARFDATGAPLSIEVRFVARDGRIVWVQEEAVLLRDAAGQPLYTLGMMQDVTARKTAEAATAQLAAIVTSSNEAIIGKTLDGIITSWNGGAEEIYGYAAAEMIGQSIALLVPPESPDELPWILEQLRAGERIAHHETVRVRKDGRRITVSLTLSPIRDAQEQIIGASTIARDVSARRAMEDERERLREAVQRSEEQYRRIVETTNEGIWMVDGQLTITFANQRFAQMLGYTVAELFGRSALALTDDDRTTMEGALERRRQGQAEQREVRMRRKDGTLLWLLMAATPLRDAQGQFQGILAMATDITARKAAEEAQWTSEQRYRTLVEQLPTVTYIAAPGDEGALLYLSPQIEPMLGFTPAEWSSDPLFWTTRLHPDDRDRVLASSARFDATGQPWQSEHRFLARDGRVVWLQEEAVLVRDAEGDPLYTLGIMLDITARKEAEEALLRLNAGLEQAVVERTTQLDAARAEAEAANQAKTVGHGSTFWIELPLHAEPMADPQVPDALQSLPTQEEQAGRTVLYIEDNLANLRLIERLLANWTGTTLLSALQGGLGLELARQHHPDVILLDLHLPDVPGREVLRRLKDDTGTATIPVVVISADATPHEIERVHAAGAHAYLTKPLDVSAFLRTLHEIWDRKQ